MCGLSGILHWDRQPVHAGELEEMARLLRHRGPDHQAVALPSDGVGLSHARLSVIDLSPAAAQPMSNESKTIWVCFNGEIYNFQELRRELEAGGACFRSRSDTEVILRAYERWGKEAFRRLDGMFAIALWDSQSRTLLLVRDRAGKKPLHYWTDGCCAVFASEMKALFAHAHVPRRVREPALGHLLALGYPPPGETCYAGIRQVPPASISIFREGMSDPSVSIYWTLSAEKSPALNAAEVSEQLRHLLSEAVKRRLIADVPLGVFLSGGIDSTVVVGLMRRLNPSGSIKTFSIGFEGDPLFNEVPYARTAAQAFQTDHTVFTVGPQSFDLLERLVRHYDQPFADSSALPTTILSGLTRTQVTVALTGDGGDELFAGYDRFQAALAAERIPVELRRAGRLLFSMLPRGSASRGTWTRIQRFVQAAEKPLEQRYFLWMCLFQDPARILRDSSAGVIPENNGAWRRAPSMPGASALDRLLLLNFHDYLPNDLLVKTDRCSMAHGLECRSPFLDTALTEWAFQLPDVFKVRAGQGKWVLRHAFRDLLPTEIQRRKKMGFGVPLGRWFREQWRTPLRDHLENPAARIWRYVRQEPVQRIVRDHLEGKTDAGHALWLLLTFEVWLRQNSF